MPPAKQIVNPSCICTLSAYHFELLLESSRPGLCKEIESYHYKQEQSFTFAPNGSQKATKKVSSTEDQTEIGYGKIRLLVIAAFLNGPRDFIYLHLPFDTTQGELLVFKGEKEAKQFFSHQKKRLSKALT